MQNIKLSLRAGGAISLGDLEHPNKMPFEGLLTYFDIPSDKPVGGANGKRVVIPSNYGIPSLASLKGMAVDFDPLLMDKHVAKHKIGIIDEAWTGERLENGSLPVFVRGYVFAHDFPDEASDIKEYQSELGFSYETIDTPVMDGVYEGEPVLQVCGEVVFSGAAILLAEKAAFTQTSLAAQAEENEEMEGNNLELDQIIAAVMAAIEAKYEMQAKSQQEEVQEAVEKVMEAVVEGHVEIESQVADALSDLTAEGETAEVKEEEVKEETVELQAEAEVVEEVKEEEVETNVETVDFQAMAVDLQASVDALKKELADLKAEAEEKEKNTHKGFAYPTTLAAKYNLEAAADTYEAKIASIDARTDLSTDERMALGCEYTLV